MIRCFWKIMYLFVALQKLLAWPLRVIFKTQQRQKVEDLRQKW
jgi:hypothetical protein